MTKHQIIISLFIKDICYLARLTNGGRANDLVYSK
jgi:hypothetical protein